MDPETIRRITNQQAKEDLEAKKRAKKYGNSSSSDSSDAELLGVLVVCAGYGIYKGGKFLGKAAIEGGKMAVEGGKIAGKTVINAHKLHKGEIEIVNTDNQGNIVEKTPETAPVTPHESPTFSKREKVKEWIGKGVKRSKSASELITSAYKLSTSTTEEVITDADDKTKVIIKSTEANNNNVNTEGLIPTKIKPLIDKQNKYYGEIREDNLNTSIKYKFDNKIVELTKYKTFTFPNTIMPGKAFDLKFPLYCLNGEKINAYDPACLQISYDIDGKLAKLTLPNPPILCHNPYYPVLIGYHNNPYTVPVNSGHYEYIVQEISKNHGVIVIGNADPAYHIEAMI